jgi:hypothetical protein
MKLPPTIDVSADSRLIGIGCAARKLDDFLEVLVTVDGLKPTAPMISEPKSLRAPVSEIVERHVSDRPPGH